MGIRIEDLFRGFVKQAVPAATGYLAGRMKGEEIKREREEREHAMRLAAEQRAREEEDRQRRIARTKAEDERRAERDERERVEREYERANPYEYNGRRFSTEEAMLEAIRRRREVEAEVTSRYRAPRAASTRTATVQSATGDARRWFSRPGQTVEGAVRTLLKKYPGLQEGEAWKIAQDAMLWGNKRLEDTGTGSRPSVPRIGG